MLESPIGPKVLKERVMRRTDQAISEAGVSHGVDSEAISEAAEAFAKEMEEGANAMVARKVAVGDAPEPGRDGRLEYPLNPDNLPMHKVTATPPTSKRRW